MKKLVKNSALLKHCMVIALAATLCIISIIYFAQSYYFESDEWGTSLSFDEDSIVLFLCSVSILIYGIYSLYAYKRNTADTAVYYSCFGVASFLLAFYPLGKFFKALAKGGKFTECQEYLYIGILGLLMIAYLIFSYLSCRREK